MNDVVSEQRALALDLQDTASSRREEFLILPHAEVLGFFQRKANDYERWLRGMRRLRDKVMSGGA